MTLAFLVYLGLTLALTAVWISPAGKVAGGVGRPSLYVNNVAAVISIILFTLLIGGRYNVGGDFTGYINMYRSTSLGGTYEDVFFEPGFWLMIQILKLFGLPERSVIVVSSFLQIGLFSLWLRKHPQIAPFAVFCIMTLILLDINNIVRQGIAFFSILLALSAIAERRWVTFLGWGVFAYLFHKSALIVIPIGFVLRWMPLPKVQPQVLALICSYAFVGLFFDQVVNLFTAVAATLGYSGYSDITREDLVFSQEDFSLNLGIYFWPLVDFFVIWYSVKIRDHFKTSHYSIYHNVYLIAALLQPVANAWDFIPFARGLFYFVAMRPICVAFLMYYCLVVSRKPRDVAIAIGIGAAFLAWFVVAISRGAAWSSPYQFY